MKTFAFIFFLIVHIVVQAQSTDSTDATVQLRIYNPTERSITLLMENKLIVDGYKPMRTFTLLPKDTTDIPLEVILAENRVPSNDYEFSIYEAPDYRAIVYHSNWECKRTVPNLEVYSCLHKIYEQIGIADSIEFDSTTFYRDYYNQFPIYENYDVDSLPRAVSGEIELIKGAIALIEAERPQKSLRIFVQMIVEVDGSVSAVEIVKTNEDDYNQLLIEYFFEANFIPAYRKKLKVRSKIVLPISIRVE